MKGGTPDGSQRRRSARLTSPQNNVKVDNMAPAAAVKRSITVRKIAPRKTAVPSEHNKENEQRRPVSEGGGGEQKKLKVSTPGPVLAEPAAKKAAMPSPILASPPPCRPQPAAAAAADPEDLVWSKKVRRSYSRLSDPCPSSPSNRESLFGFDKMKTPEVMRKATGTDRSGCLSGLNSFTSLLEAEDSAPSFPEPDTNIPGVAVVKEKKRRRKVQQIDITELDALAAKMNAEFDEAEGFDLVVE